MKSTKLILSVLLGIGALSASAQADYRLGFCDNSQTIADKRVDLGGDGGTLQAAIYLSGEDLARVSDGSFTGVNVGINTTYNIGSVTGWIRTSLDGEDLASATITRESSPSIFRGWNAIKFETPLEIKPDQGYYVGYTYKLAKAAGMTYMSAQSDLTTDGGCWMCTDGQTWSESKSYGTLFVEALIQSESLPLKDLTLTGAAFDHDVYPVGSKIGLDYKLYNVGLETVKNFDITLKCEEAGVTITRTVECDLPYNERGEYSETYEMPDLEIGKSYAFTVSIDNVNGVADQNPKDNSITLPELPAIEKMFDRTVVLEEFTTERCGNCPNAANHVRYMLNAMNDEERARTIVLCHHSGFYTDTFTQPCDQEYLGFYMGSTFAPAFMVDRAPQGSSAPVFSLISYMDLKNKVVARQDEPAYYSMDATGSHDATSRTVKLKVTGKAARQRCEHPRITVYLTEDEVPALVQSGTSDRNYKHQHLIRSYNATWGESPVWDGDLYSYECELTYSEGCKVDDMEVIAMLSNADPADVTNRQIENAFKVSLNSLKPTVDVEEVAGEAVRIYTEGSDIHVSGAYESLEVYDMSGRRVRATDLSAGIYVAHVTTTEGTVTANVVIR